jgi:hypothetical protein
MLGFLEKIKKYFAGPIAPVTPLSIDEQTSLYDSARRHFSKELRIAISFDSKSAEVTESEVVVRVVLTDQEFCKEYRIITIDRAIVAITSDVIDQNPLAWERDFVVNLCPEY